MSKWKLLLILLHELCHAKLRHVSFNYLEPLKKEIETKPKEDQEEDTK